MRIMLILLNIRAYCYTPVVVRRMEVGVEALNDVLVKGDRRVTLKLQRQCLIVHCI